MNFPKILLTLVLSLYLVVMHSSVSAGSEINDATEQHNKQVPTPNLWLVKEGKHTSLILRTADTTDALPLAEANAEMGPFVMLSWGDAAYYQTADKTLQLTLNALFLPTSAALNARSLDSLHEAPQTRGKAKLYPMTVGAENLSRILSRIAATLDTQGPTQANGALVGVDNQYVGGRFYPALDRRYSLLFTCNSWVADVLTAGGLHFSKWSAQTASNLVLQHKLQWLLSSNYRQQTQFSSIAVTTVR